MSASSSCKCWPGRQTVCMHVAPKGSRMLARSVGDGRRSLTAPAQRKEEGGSLCPASSSYECRPDRQTVCIHLALKRKHQSLHRRAAATLLDLSKIPHGSGAKQRGRPQPLSASSSCECRPGNQTFCIHLALKSRRQRLRRRAAASLLDWSELQQ